MYAELYDEVGRARFEAAYDSVLKSSRFRPDISELREAAGARLKSRAEIEREDAENDLRRILALIRAHGPKLKAIPGKVLKDRDDDGRLMESWNWEREPAKPCPQLSPGVERTIEGVGSGDFWYGIQRLSTHPACRGTGDAEPLHPVEVRRIEERWHEDYRRAAATAEETSAA